MFSMFIAWASFIITSIIFFILVLDSILNADYNRKMARFYKYTYFTKRMLLIILVWVISGIYIWG